MDYGARFYSPSLGQFVSADTIVPSPSTPYDLNHYAYAHGNPLKHIDPTGHFLPLLFIAGAIVVGALIGGGIGATTSVVEQHREADAAHTEFQLDVDRTARTAMVGAGIGALGGAIAGVGGVAFAAAGGAITYGASMAGASTIASAGAINAVGSGFGYLGAALVQHDAVKADDAALAIGWGFVNGAANRAVMGPASGVIAEKVGGGTAASGFFGGATTAGEYVSRQYIHNQPINSSVVAANFGFGAMVGGMDRGVLGNGYNPNPLLGLFSNHSWALQKTLYAIASAGYSAARSGGGYFISSYGVTTVCRYGMCAK
jgi:hypothetical protein